MFSLKLGEWKEPLGLFVSIVNDISVWISINQVSAQISELTNMLKEQKKILNKSGADIYRINAKLNKYEIHNGLYQKSKNKYRMRRIGVNEVLGGNSLSDEHLDPKPSINSSREEYPDSASSSEEVSEMTQNTSANDSQEFIRPLSPSAPSSVYLPPPPPPPPSAPSSVSPPPPPPPPPRIPSSKISDPPLVEKPKPTENLHDELKKRTANGKFNFRANRYEPKSLKASKDEKVESSNLQKSLQKGLQKIREAIGPESSSLSPGNEEWLSS